MEFEGHNEVPTMFLPKGHASERAAIEILNQRKAKFRKPIDSTPRLRQNALLLHVTARVPGRLTKQQVESAAVSTGLRAEYIMRTMEYIIAYEILYPEPFSSPTRYSPILGPPGHVLIADWVPLCLDRDGELSTPRESPTHKQGLVVSPVETSAAAGSPLTLTEITATLHAVGAGSQDCMQELDALIRGGCVTVTDQHSYPLVYESSLPCGALPDA